MDNVRRAALLPSHVPSHGGHQTWVLSSRRGFRPRDSGTIPRTMGRVAKGEGAWNPGAKDAAHASRVPAARSLAAVLGSPRNLCRLNGIIALLASAQKFQKQCRDEA